MEQIKHYHLKYNNYAEGHCSAAIEGRWVEAAGAVPREAGEAAVQVAASNSLDLVSLSEPHISLLVSARLYPRGSL